MEQEFESIRQESRELGGSPSPGVAVNNVRTRIYELDDPINRLERTAMELGASAKDLDELREQVGDTSVFTAGDAAQEGAEKVVERQAAKVCTKVVARSLGWISLIGDVVEYGGKLVIRELNEDSIRDLVRRERLNLTDLYELLEVLRCQRAEERAKLKRLKELRVRENALFPRLAAARQHARELSRPATDRAVLDREMDEAGDREERRQYLRDGVRPSDPSTAPRPGRNIVEPATPRQAVDRSHSSAGLPPFAQDMLVKHNAERARFGYQPVRWNPTLAANAQIYANRLAQTGQLEHAPREGRGIERENLSQGLAGWNASQLMASWIEERRLFRPGVFPDVSATNNWFDVGHYSQMIWPQTTDIGCGIATGSGFSWLVCRYSPGGNKDGKPVGLPPASM